MHVVLMYSDNILGSATETPRGKNGDKRKTPNQTCSGSVVEVFSWLYSRDGFRQRKICMAEWGILEEGAHKQRYYTYMPISDSALLTYN